MMGNKAKHNIVWKTLKDTPTLAQWTMGPQVPTPTIPVCSSIQAPRCNERVVMQPDRFMYLGEFFKAIPKLR